MSIGAKIAGLSVVTVPVVGLSQLHWIVSHFSTIATGAAAITVGAGVWGGHALIGKVKGRKEQKAVEPQTQEHLAAQAQAYLDSIRSQALPRSRQVIDYTNAEQSVSKRV